MPRSVDPCPRCEEAAPRTYRGGLAIHCAACSRCGAPGHVRRIDGRRPITVAGCDRCFPSQRLRRHALVASFYGGSVLTLGALLFGCWLLAGTIELEFHGPYRSKCFMWGQDPNRMRHTSTTRIVRHFAAPPSAVYRALTDGDAVATWMVPDGMTSRVHEFDVRANGAFRISLTYAGAPGTGKTDAHTDTYRGRFERLVRDAWVVQSMELETEDDDLRGTMTVTFELTAVEGGTRLVALHEHVPRGILPADNELGWSMALDKLAKLLGA